MRCIAVMLSAALAGAGFGSLHSLEHGPATHAHDHQHHVHTHKHSGYVHTHAHSHGPHEEHPADDAGDDHHRYANGHGEPEPVQLTTAFREYRRFDKVEFAGLSLIVADPLRPHSSGLAPPDRPPQLPTSQDSLIQLRTVVLLT